jgi:hypothetical protein
MSYLGTNTLMMMLHKLCIVPLLYTHHIGP